MCTAISFLQNHHFFGRTLDYELSYGEGVTITPRHFPFHFRNGEVSESHYAMIGMATVAEGYPLYYDATNEKGLSMAGLLFSGNAVYSANVSDAGTVASFECIPWVLSKCATTQEARELLSRVRITDEAFNGKLPPSPLHWMVADKNSSIVIESLKDGVHIHENPVGVLTNNPPFDYHMLHLTEYLQLTDKPPCNTLYSETPLQPYSRGMGAIGLPGDYSSASRFVKAVFAKNHAAFGKTLEEEIMQHFHVLRTVEVPRGNVTLSNGKQVITVYTSCCDTEKEVYYYSTYENSAIFCVDMHAEDLTKDRIVWYPLSRKPRFESVNTAVKGDAL